MLAMMVVRKTGGRTAGSMAALFCAAVLTVLLATGCGSKGPPLPPRQPSPPVVKDLKADVDGRRLTLSWTDVAGTPGTAAVDGYLVYRFKQSLQEKECEGCPLLFEKIAMVPSLASGGDRAGANSLTYRETLDSGFRYAYKVVATTPGGVRGEDSNIIRVNLK